jgi:riboflavin kinase/FMN adenylyltransferase
MASIGSFSKPAVTNIGTRPTFGAGERTVEAHLLDYQGDLYDQEIGLSFLDRLREERKFDSVSDLVAQIGRDVEQARQSLAPP